MKNTNKHRNMTSEEFKAGCEAIFGADRRKREELAKKPRIVSEYRNETINRLGM